MSNDSAATRLDETGLREVSVRAVRLWNERRLDEFYEAFNAELVYHAPDGTIVHGVAALRERYDAALAWCPDLRITTTLLVTDPANQTLASIQTEQGTAPDGSAFGFEGMTFFRLDNGLIVEAWELLRPL